MLVEQHTMFCSLAKLSAEETERDCYLRPHSCVRKPQRNRKRKEGWARRQWCRQVNDSPTSLWLWQYDRSIDAWICWILPCNTPPPPLFLPQPQKQERERENRGGDIKADRCCSIHSPPPKRGFSKGIVKWLLLPCLGDNTAQKPPGISKPSSCFRAEGRGEGEERKSRWEENRKALKHFSSSSVEGACVSQVCSHLAHVH